MERMDVLVRYVSNGPFNLFVSGFLFGLTIRSFHALGAVYSSYYCSIPSSSFTESTSGVVMSLKSRTLSSSSSVFSVDSYSCSLLCLFSSFRTFVLIGVN